MKKIILSLACIMLAAVCMAQTSKRMPLPKLKFSDKAQQELFDRIASQYNANEDLGFEGEFLNGQWEGHQRERLCLAFLQYLVWNKDSFGDVLPSKDAVSVGKTLIDWYMEQTGKKVPVAYPFNYKAYKACVEGFLNPVRDEMCGGSQMDMNQFAYVDGDMSQFLGMLKQYLVSARFRSSNLKTALDAENEAWLQLRNSVSNTFYQHKVDINDGMAYSMLPLEVAGMLDYTDRVRDSSLSVLYAISADEPGTVYFLSEEDLSETPAYFTGSMKEVGTDTSSFVKALDNFMEKRKAVGELLPEYLKEIYRKDTMRYYRILLRMMASEDDCQEM
ncbi:MAG: hypothetical protein IJK74_03225 [Bacteroidales bacterium]|nr:hypothetical protein [Bacteroidales bacterium]